MTFKLDLWLSNKSVSHLHERKKIIPLSSKTFVRPLGGLGENRPILARERAFVGNRLQFKSPNPIVYSHLKFSGARVGSMPGRNLNPRLEVDYIGGKRTELLVVESDAPKIKLLIVPGNPGIVGFYEEYLRCLSESFDGKASIVVISHLGHTLENDKSGKLFSLEDQIKHKIDYMEEAMKIDDYPWVLVGHSIGAHIALEVLKAMNSPRIDKVLGLYPFLSLNKRSTWQTVLDFAAHRQLLLSVPLAISGQVIGKLPNFLLNSAVSTSIGANWSPSAVETFRQYMLQYHMLRNYAYMGMTEFDTLPVGAKLDWDFLRAHSSKISFVFSVDDHWGPLSLKEQIAGEVPGLQQVVELEGHDHAFCCSIEGSKWVAMKCAELASSYTAKEITAT